jgi:hypothetical protein
MHKKLEIQELDIPIDDIECWERYPKHRWVYDLSRLLDAQNIKWSLFETDALKDKELNIYLESLKEIEYDPGYIYINRPNGFHTLAEVYLTKGEIKLTRYFDKRTLLEINEFIGNIELRVNAFVSMHFQKFTGVITMEFVGNDIMSIRLRAYPELGQNTESIKLTKRIYKKTEIIVSGPTDQALHEKVAS